MTLAGAPTALGEIFSFESDPAVSDSTSAIGPNGLYIPLLLVGCGWTSGDEKSGLML